MSPEAFDILERLPQLPEGAWPPNYAVERRPFVDRPIGSIFVVSDEWRPGQTQETVAGAFPDIEALTMTARELVGRLVKRDPSLRSHKDSLAIFTGWSLLIDKPREEVRSDGTVMMALDGSCRWVPAVELSRSLQAVIGRIPVAICLPPEPDPSKIIESLREGGAVGLWKWPTIHSPRVLRSRFEELVRNEGLIVIPKSGQPTALAPE